METKIRNKLTAAARALQFAQAHPDTDPSYVAVVTRLQDAVAQSDSQAIQQRDGTVDEHAARDQRLDVRQQMHDQLKHLARVARDALKDHPELQGAFTLPPSNAPHMAFITAAKSMLATATAQQALLVGLGLGTTFIDSLSQAVTTFDSTTAGASTGRQDHVGARADLGVLAAECVHLIGLLDGLNRARFRGDAELLAEWKSAKRVLKHTPKAEVPAPAPESDPVPLPLPVSAEGRGVK